MDTQYATATVTMSARYAELTDHSLAVALSTEDTAEEHGLDQFERTTCYAHRRWLRQCVSSPSHVVRVSGQPSGRAGVPGEPGRPVRGPRQPKPTDNHLIH